MAAISELDDRLRSPHTGLSLLEALQLPVSAILGVSDVATTALSNVGVRTIFDLGSSTLFAQASAAAGLGSSGFGTVPSDLLKDTVANTAPADVPSLSLNALRALSDQAAAELTTALDVDTIREFAFWPPRVVAHRMVGEASGTQLGDAADVAADRLRPQLGEYPTERVYFDSLVMLGTTDSQAQTPLTGSLSLDTLADIPVGFGKPAIGGLATYAQSWFAQGVTLGHMVHSLALAPGEATRIAVVDWSRRSRAATTEAIDEAERLTNSLDHARAISEVQNAVADEMQSGGSMTSGWARSESRGKSSAGSIGGGVAGVAKGVTGALGFGFGGSSSRQESETAFGASSTSWSVGTRSVMAGMTQRVNDRTEQHASSVRNRRASAVREVSQSEHEQVSTRVVANYNHMHALTVQYYEVVQVYRVTTQLHAFKRVLFVPFELLDFSKPNAEELISRFRGALLPAALTPRVEALLSSPQGDIEVRSAVRVNAPLLSPLVVHPAAGTVATVATAATSAVSDLGGGSAQPGDAGASAGVAQPAPRPPRTVARPGPLTEILPGDASLASLSFESVSVDRVRVDREGVAAAVSTFVVPATTAQIDFTSGIPLHQVTTINLATADGEAGEGTMFVTYETGGRSFSFAVPIEVGSGTGMQRVAYFSGDASDRLGELIEHLQAHRGYYTQAVLRNLDAASLTLLLADVSWQGRPLGDQIEPAPVAVTGNFLVFSAPVEDGDPSGLSDGTQTWADLLNDRDITFDQGDSRIIPIPTGGVFAEAVLGRSNSAEKLDITRFWNWQDSPIPLQPTEIAPVATGSRAQQESLAPGQLGQPVVNLVMPPGVPDPAGLSAVLGAVASGNMFRDQSGLAGTQAAAQAASAGTLEAATAAGRLASENFQAATQQATEMGKAAADMWKVMKGGSQGSGGPRSAGISGDGARINQGRDLDRRGVPSGPATSATSGPRPGSGSANEMPGLTGPQAELLRQLGGGDGVPLPVSRELAAFDEAVAISPALFQQAAASGAAAATVPAASGLVNVLGFFESLFLERMKDDFTAAGVSLQGADLISMRHHDNFEAFAGKESAGGANFAAWTQSTQHIYVNVGWFWEFLTSDQSKSTEQAVRDTRAAAYLMIRHELNHVQQFAGNGGSPPSSFEQMIEFEADAYAADDTWLGDPQTTTFITQTLRADASLIATFQGGAQDAAAKFSQWKALTTEQARRQQLVDAAFLPRSIRNNTSYSVTDLYSTAAPPP